MVNPVARFDFHLITSVAPQERSELIRSGRQGSAAATPTWAGRAGVLSRAGQAPIRARSSGRLPEWTNRHTPYSRGFWGGVLAEVPAILSCPQFLLAHIVTSTLRLKRDEARRLVADEIDPSADRRVGRIGA